MVNNTVNGKKIGKAAGKDDKIKFTCMSTTQEINGQPELKIENSSNILNYFRSEDIIQETDTQVVIKAYPGGNPKKEKEEKNNSSDKAEKEEKTH